MDGEATMLDVRGARSDGLPAGHDARPTPGDALTWAVFSVVLLHNVEEALTMGRFLDSSQILEQALGFAPSRLLVPFLIAVTVVTAAIFALVLAATRAPAGHWTRSWVRIVAWVMVINVLAPHVPAAVVHGGYAPGVLTSVLLVQPVGLLYLRRSAGSR
jgi:hypothetical protein